MREQKNYNEIDTHTTFKSKYIFVRVHASHSLDLFEYFIPFSIIMSTTIITTALAVAVVVLGLTSLSSNYCSSSSGEMFCWKDMLLR